MAGKRVSIHAPAWGATLNYLNMNYNDDCFNPRARVGRDYFEDGVRNMLAEVSIHAPAWGAT